MEQRETIGAAPCVSVIIPVYDVAKYLRQCIESVLQQTFPDWEMLLVVGASHDGSTEICERYAEQDLRIRVLHQTGKGLVNARQEGIRAAKGFYVYYLDGDDWIESYALSEMVGAMQGYDLLIAAHYEEYGADSRKKQGSLPLRCYERQDITERILPTLCADFTKESWNVLPYVWDKFFVREFLLPAQLEVPADITIGEDLACVARYLMRANRVNVTDRAYCHYRQRLESSVRQRSDAGSLLRSTVLLDTCLADAMRQTLPPHVADSVVKKMRRSQVDNTLLPRCYDIWPDLAGDEDIFLFGEIPEAARIIIYGAGILGASLYRALQRKDGNRVAGWLDRDAMFYQSQGWPVQLPEVIRQLTYDAVLVSLTKPEAQKCVVETLEQMGVPKHKIRSAEISKASELEEKVCWMEKKSSSLAQENS